MSQTELQRYDNKEDFYKNIRNIIDAHYNNDFRLHRLSNNLEDADGSDYPTAEAATLTALDTFRTALDVYLAASSTTTFLAAVKGLLRI